MSQTIDDQELYKLLFWLRDNLPELEVEPPPPPSPELLDLAWQTVQKLQVAYGIQPAPPPPTLWQRLRDWLFPDQGWKWQQGLATATLALLVVVGVMPFLRQPGLVDRLDDSYSRWDYAPLAQEWPWRSVKGPTKGENTRGPERLAPTPDQLAFRNGVRMGLAHLAEKDPSWNQSLTDWPESLPACASEEPSCEQRRSVYQAAGRWAVLLYWQCRRQGVEPQFWDSQKRIREQLLDALEEQTPLAEELRDWRGETPQALLCGGVGDWLQLGLINPEK